MTATEATHEAASRDKNCAADAAPRPYFIPPGVDFDSIPEGLRAAIVDILQPTYRELVLRAVPGIEQSAGLTVVHLLWLEMLDQLNLGDSSQVAGGTEDAPAREEKIAQHLKLLGAKATYHRFLLRLQDFHQRYAMDIALRTRAAEHQAYRELDAGDGAAASTSSGPQAPA